MDFKLLATIQLLHYSCCPNRHCFCSGHQGLLVGSYIPLTWTGFFFGGGSHLLALNAFNAFLLLSAVPVKYSKLRLCSLCFNPRPSYFSQDPQTWRTELAPDIWVLGPIAPRTFWLLQVSLS